MTQPDELSGKVVAGVEQDGIDRVRLRFTDGTVVEFTAGSHYGDSSLDCELFTQEDWHETLTARRRCEEEAEQRRAAAPPPSAFWQTMIDDARRDTNRQILGQTFTIPIRMTRSDVSE